MKLASKSSFAAVVMTFAICGAQALHADVTLRYQTEIKPAAVLEPFLGPLQKAMEAQASTSVQMKGNLGFTQMGKWSEIIDFVKGEATLLDPAHKTYAKVPLTGLMDKLAGALSQQSSQQSEAMNQVMASIKTHVDSKVTGKTAEIEGIQAEEREVVFTMDIPMPSNMPQQSGPSVKLVVDIWTAKKDENLRVQALRELAGYYAWQKYVMNPAGIFDKLAGQMPGMKAAMGPLVDEMFKNQSVILRTHMEIYVPLLAGVAKQMAARGQSFPAIDPEAPLMVMDQKIAELSSAPVDAALFEVPKDYSSVAIEDMAREMIKPPATGK